VSGSRRPSIICPLCMYSRWLCCTGVAKKNFGRTTCSHIHPRATPHAAIRQSCNLQPNYRQGLSESTSQGGNCPTAAERVPYWDPLTAHPMATQGPRRWTVPRYLARATMRPQGQRMPPPQRRLQRRSLARGRLRGMGHRCQRHPWPAEPAADMVGGGGRGVVQTCYPPGASKAGTDNDGLAVTNTTTHDRTCSGGSRAPAIPVKGTAAEDRTGPPPATPSAPPLRTSDRRPPMTRCMAAN
jgi:hypothetical protein